MPSLQKHLASPEAQTSELPAQLGKGYLNLPGETDLATLLQDIRPILHPDPFAFCTLDVSDFAALPNALLAVAVGLFRETEGVTVILPRAEAERANFSVDQSWALITLSVHSDLSAVGFLAAVTARLAENGISVNPVAAFFHDHLFVPYDCRYQALRLLSSAETAPAEND